MRAGTCCGALLTLVLFGGVARADELAPPARESVPVAERTELGLASRAAQPGYLEGDVTLAVSGTGPGGAAQTLGGEVGARLGLGHGLAARVTVQRDANGNQRPGVGLLWQFAGRDGGPLAMTLGGRYRAEGFTEPEGELELQFFGSYRKGRLECHANAVAGADPEFAEGDGEGLVMLGLRPQDALLVGAEARTRWAFGKEAGGPGMVKHDEIAGALAQYQLSRVLLTALVGTTRLTTSATSSWMPTALVRLAYGF